MTTGLRLARRIAGFLGRRLRRSVLDAGWGPGLSRKKARSLIKTSGVFDEAWYRAKYQTTDHPIDDAIGDFLTSGQSLGRDPSPLFWTAWYGAAHPEAWSSGGGPLVHYLQGKGTNPNPLFDDEHYRSQVGLIDQACGLSHFLTAGWQLGLNPHPLFDTEWYLAHCTAETGEGDPLTHFLTSPADATGDPCEHFDSQSYLARYPDVSVSGMNPLAHFLLGGIRDLRNPSPRFNTARYLRRTPDARVSALNPLIHAIQAGKALEPDIYRAPVNRQPMPALSVTTVVPNFNHGEFISQRLQSIAGQSIPPDEILILDDASSDDSLASIRAFAADCPISVRILENTANSGSPFRQWAKGIAEAKGDLVWMAESDDFNEPDFLRAVLPAFNDPLVSLSYCQSRPVDERGRPFAADYTDYTDDLSMERWRSPYVADGTAEVSIALAHKNTIPNGSAVVFRRKAAIDHLPELATYRQCGDWFLYLRCAEAGQIAFTPDVLNDHRRHVRALTLTLGSNLTPLEEALRLRLLTFQCFELSGPTVLGSIAAVVSEYVGRTAPDRISIMEAPLLAPGLASLLEHASRHTNAVPKQLHIFGSQPKGPFDGFVAMARPLPQGDMTIGDDAGIWIEGSPYLTAWSMPTLWARNRPAADQRRVEIMSLLLKVHGIGSITADQGAAMDLAEAVSHRSGVPVADSRCAA